MFTHPVLIFYIMCLKQYKHFNKKKNGLTLLYWQTCEINQIKHKCYPERL